MNDLKEFTGFGSFGIAEARIPIKQVRSYLATRLQLELVRKILLDQQVTLSPLATIRDPDLSKINYLFTVRGGVETIWHQIWVNIEDLPTPRLLHYLDQGWGKSQQQIDGAGQKEARRIFEERALKKAEIIEEEAKRLAAEKGMPALLRWLENLIEECDHFRGETIKEEAKYGEQKKKQKKNLDDLKKEWVELLGKEGGGVEPTAKRFLLLAGIFTLIGFFLWFFNISLPKLASLIGAGILLFLVLWVARPLIRKFLTSRRFEAMRENLTTGYRALSFSSLDELAKKIEVEYWERLRSHIESIEKEYRQRIVDLKCREEILEKRLNEVKACLERSEPTVRRLFNDDDLEDWYKHGFEIALPILPQWAERMANLKEEIVWEKFENEAHQCFNFLENIRAEDELYRHYPNKDERMKFLLSLREAILGNTETEAFAALNLSTTLERPEVNLFIGIDDHKNSKLAKELYESWGHSGVGLVITDSDKSAITMISQISSIPFTSLDEYPEINSSFKKVKEKEGVGIYPILFPKKER